MDLDYVDSRIRRVPGFPKPGILFYDVTGILLDPRAFSTCIDALCDLVQGSGADTVTAVEARGFVFAAPVAERLNLPLVLIRKKGKLPNPVVSTDFALEYGTDTICIQKVDLASPRAFFVIDDLIATGGTLKAAASLIEAEGSTIGGIGAVIGLPFLGYPDILSRWKTSVLIPYQGE